MWPGLIFIQDIKSVKHLLLLLCLGCYLGTPFTYCHTSLCLLSAKHPPEQVNRNSALLGKSDVHIVIVVPAYLH